MKKKRIVRTGKVVFISLLFLATSSIVNAQTKGIDQSSSTVVIWEEEPTSGHYLGMVEALSGQLFAYSEVFVHTLVPKPQNGHQGIPMVYMDVFLEELRPDHEAYLILPYIVYYKINGPFNWERHDVYSPVPLLVSQGETFNRFHIGTLGFGKKTSEDVVYPFRTGIACFHFIGNEWVKVDSMESDLGFWYLDVSPYSFISFIIMLAS